MRDGAAAHDVEDLEISWFEAVLCIDEEESSTHPISKIFRLVVAIASQGFTEQTVTYCFLSHRYFIISGPHDSLLPIP